MGTKHGYTEKRCSKCGKMKNRDEFPKRGGMSCKVCANKEQRETQSNYPRDPAARREYMKKYMRNRRKRNGEGK